MCSQNTLLKSPHKSFLLFNYFYIIITLFFWYVLFSGKHYSFLRQIRKNISIYKKKPGNHMLLNGKSRKKLVPS